MMRIRIGLGRGMSTSTSGVLVPHVSARLPFQDNEMVGGVEGILPKAIQHYKGRVEEQRRQPLSAAEMVEGLPRRAGDDGPGRALLPVSPPCPDILRKEHAQPI